MHNYRLGDIVKMKIKALRPADGEDRIRWDDENNCLYGQEIEIEADLEVVTTTEFYKKIDIETAYLLRQECPQLNKLLLSGDDKKVKEGKKNEEKFKRIATRYVMEHFIEISDPRLKTIH